MYFKYKVMIELTLPYYGLTFYKKENGSFNVQSSSHRSLAIYIYIYRYKEDVQMLLSDINLALSGQFNQIEDPSWGGDLGGDVYSGIINSNITFTVLTDYDSIDYPLLDIQNIFTSWLAFIS